MKNRLKTILKYDIFARNCIQNNMLEAGNYYKLRVNRVSDYGLFLIDDDQQEVLLPNRYVSLENKVDDMIDVFVYHDSEDRLVAAIEHPIATVGQVAFLRVVDKTIHGAFLDWGITAKDLFMPNRNQLGGVVIGEKCVVYIYRDNITGRAVATSKLNGFINNTELTLKPREEVEIMIAVNLPLGYRVVINNRHWGMLYHNQIFAPVSIGDKMTAFVTKITDDNRVDISLQQQGYDEVKRSADRLLDIITRHGGSFHLGDDSAPEDIYAQTGMSKKVFKRSIGYLLKKGSLEKCADGIKIVNK